MRYDDLNQAVVLGGSLAGMLAARVLADHFERVVVVEQDEYPTAPMARGGVPQARHLHALLTRGHRVLDRLFPGIAEDWYAAGAEILDLGRDFAWRTPAGWGVRFESGLESLAASRPLIDYVVRERVAKLPNVEIETGTVVLSLAGPPRGSRIAGIRVRTPGGLTKTVSAALVVDASGRMSNAPAWLKRLGYDAPAETVIDAKLGYASRMYERRPGHERAWRAVFIQAAPPDQPRAGIAFPVEGNRWMITLCGGGGDFAPTRDDQFVEFARSLPSGEIHNLIRDAEPLGPITGYRRTENRWRHYERSGFRPEGFIVMGDAACAFNPVYGQGMTVAALEALALDEWLRDGTGSASAFQKALARIIATPWALATGEDMRYNGASAKPKLHEKILQRWVHQVMGVSSYDCDVRRALLEVFSMVAEPSRLMRPDVVRSVALSAFRRGLGSRQDVPAFAPETA